ncbi:MAG: hypothetical protein V1814_02695 [Candidatus Moraniibacteriota bacterium]
MPEANIVRGKDGKLRLENFYTPLAEAKKEIRKRWKDKKLKKEILKFLENDIPPVFTKKPRAVFARHVATPNLEHQYFQRKACAAELNPLFLEYPEDKFAPENAPKYYLGKIFFLYKRGKNEGYVSSCKKIIDFDKCSGKSISKIFLNQVKLKKLVDFHHTILDKALPNLDRYDISNWYMKKGGKPEKYYKYLFSLFIRNGILFENYLLNKEEIDFTKKIIIPSFSKVEKCFNIKPLIVRLLPQKNEAEPFWYWYSGSVEKYFTQ